MRRATMIVVVVCAIGCGSSAPPAREPSEDLTEMPPAPVSIEVRELCRKVRCRPNTPVRLAAPSGEVVEGMMMMSPYVIDDVVSVVPGETLYIEGEVEGDKLVRLRIVPRVVEQARTVTVRFDQRPGGPGHMMLLTIKQETGRVMRYKAGISPLGSEDVYATSTCPVQTGIPVMEMWPEPIVHLLLAEFRFLDDDDPDASGCY
ncbi:MAG: hypothetical protein JRF63_05130 [Deltaproteobacteria bacterium]|nr:hypothetical protein [Deltaproteobacteria bacterium]